MTLFSLVRCFFLVLFSGFHGWPLYQPLYHKQQLLPNNINSTNSEVVQLFAPSPRKVSWNRLFRTISSQVLSMFTDGESTTSLGNVVDSDPLSTVFLMWCWLSLPWRVHCWLVASCLSTRTHRSFSGKLFSSSQHVWVPQTIPPQMQDSAFPLVQPQGIHLSPVLQPVPVPLDGSTTLLCISCSPVLCCLWICWGVSQHPLY